MEKRILFLMILAVIMGGCFEKENIKIGFVGSMTGTPSYLAPTSKNGAEMAVEEINKNGGINGRKIELIIEDDKNTSDDVDIADNKLADKKVVAIIGHFTSDRSVDAVPVINKREVVMISPTTSTEVLSGKDDYFFKLFPTPKDFSKFIAEKANSSIAVKKYAVIYDQTNKSFSEDWRDSFRIKFEEKGGKIIKVVSFNPKEKFDAEKSAKEIAESGAEGVLIVANAFNSAGLTEKIKKIKPDMIIISSTWAFVNFQDFINYSGKSAEGVISAQLIKENDKSGKYGDFAKKYEDTYGSKPSFGSALSYETVYILAETLKSCKKITSQELKKKLIEKGTFDGLQGKIKIDKNGDVERDIFPVIIKDKKIEEWK